MTETGALSPRAKQSEQFMLSDWVLLQSFRGVDGWLREKLRGWGSQAHDQLDEWFMRTSSCGLPFYSWGKHSLSLWSYSDWSQCVCSQHFPSDGFHILYVNSLILVKIFFFKWFLGS